VLRGAGWDAQVHDDGQAAAQLLRPGDVLHLWNVQRAWDWGDLPEVAAARGARVVVSPLFHSLDLYHRAGRRGLDGAAARVLRDPERFASLRWRRGDVRERARAVLGAADAVLLAHEDEAGLLERWCGARVDRVVVPPAVPHVVPCQVSPPFNEFLLCVGRIEPLKNPLAVLRAARALHLNAVFVGSVPRGRHLLHSRRFRREVTGSGSRWLGERSASEVAALMGMARVHVLASWTEVLGRVSVEAALAGCAVVATDVGHAPALLGRETPGLFLCPPGESKALEQAVDAAWAFGRRDAGALARAAGTLTWESVAPRLLGVYGAP